MSKLYFLSYGFVVKSHPYWEKPVQRQSSRSLWGRGRSLWFQQYKKHLFVFYSSGIVAGHLRGSSRRNNNNWAISCSVQLEITASYPSYSIISTWQVAKPPIDMIQWMPALGKSNGLPDLPVRIWRLCELLLILKEHPVSATVTAGSNLTESP